jgi:hypothetical protein
MACDCARETEPSLNEVIHLLNNPDILAKLSAPESRLMLLLKAKKPTSEVIETLFLASLCRRPSVAELALAKKHIAGFDNRTEGLKDLQHALINSNEFLLRH